MKEQRPRTVYLHFYGTSRKANSVQIEKPSLPLPMEVGPGLPEAWARQLKIHRQAFGEGFAIEGVSGVGTLERPRGIAVES